MPASKDPASTFERRLGRRFRDRALLRHALTHRSHAHEQGEGDNYERLEFLGDAVLGLLAAEWLYESFPTFPEGELSRLKAFLVSEPVLAHHAEALRLGEVLRLGVGEERSGGRQKPSLLADSIEAVFGALYLDGGIKAAAKVVLPLLAESMARRSDLDYGDPKTRLQEVAQANGWALPLYRHVAESGPDHAKVFTVECWLGGERYAVAEGRTKKLAEQRAAAAALDLVVSSPLGG